MSAVAPAMRDKVRALEMAMRAMPQVGEGDISTSHFHADGMYCRVLWRRKGVAIVGKVHKKPHFYIVASGAVSVTNGDEEPVIHRAGDVIVSQPGTKRAVVALEDSICLTVHRTAKTDLDEIEAELVEPDALALFDARNQLKALT